MRKHLLKRVKEGTSGQLLELLRRTPMTVDELAVALGVTRTAIRAQLATLERYWPGVRLRRISIQRCARWAGS